ncbi:hypothetical protein Taro_019924 [Colocasia esculenta]|uniref:[RNA-polymerase]-subunit kinase n=1 Tax=Colocasia esculenta TaxID=4460 RepID=A0A843UM79_COLES|nr:hypothetical protein [Colocasia esculenta]
MEEAAAPADPLNLGQFASWKSRSSSCYETLKLVGVGGYGFHPSAFSTSWNSMSLPTSAMEAPLPGRAPERCTYAALVACASGTLAFSGSAQIKDPEVVDVSTRREIKILETLQDEHVIHMKEIVFSPVKNAHIGDLCIVLEYMGHDLAGLSASGLKFTMPQIKCYMKQLLAGVHYCHVNHVIHRDIKGANILVNNEGYLKLADFGLARTFSWDDGGGLTDQVVTLWFRSPELLLGETDYGPAVDMWSVGCVFGQLLSGHWLPIFCADNEKQQFEVICGTCGTPDEDTWPGVSSFPKYEAYMPSSPVERRFRDRFKNLDSHALELLERMLTFNPAQRISAEEALHAEFFRVDPQPCDRESLPKYAEESHVYETERKKRWEQVRQEMERLDRGLANSGLVYPLETESHYYYPDVKDSRHKFPDWFYTWVNAGGPSTLGNIGKPGGVDDDRQ